LLVKNLVESLYVEYVHMHPFRTPDIIFHDCLYILEVLWKQPTNLQGQMNRGRDAL